MPNCTTELSKNEDEAVLLQVVKRAFEHCVFREVYVTASVQIRLYYLCNLDVRSHRNICIFTCITLMPIRHASLRNWSIAKSMEYLRHDRSDTMWLEKLAKSHTHKITHRRMIDYVQHRQWHRQRHRRFPSPDAANPKDEYRTLWTRARVLSLHNLGGTANLSCARPTCGRRHATPMQCARRGRNPTPDKPAGESLQWLCVIHRK